MLIAFYSLKELQDKTGHQKNQHMTASTILGTKEELSVELITNGPWCHNQSFLSSEGSIETPKERV